MKVVCDVIGAQELEQTLREIAPKEASNLLRRVMADMAKELRDDIRSAAPVDSGNLKKAIVSKRDRGTPGSVESSVVITKGRGVTHDAWYWHFIEFGTVVRAAKPFIIPAAEKFRSAFKETFVAKFWHEFENTLTRRRGYTIK